MNILDKFRNKAVGYWLITAGALIALVCTILYLVFGVSSHTFSAGIFVLLLFSALIGISLTFYDKLFGDFFVIAFILLFTFALGMFISDSVFDFADAITKIQLYGNMANAPFRVVVIVFSVIGILCGIVGSFIRRVRKDKNVG